MMFFSTKSVLDGRLVNRFDSASRFRSSSNSIFCCTNVLDTPFELSAILITRDLLECFSGPIQMESHDAEIASLDLRQ